MIQLEIDNVYTKIMNMEKDYEIKLWDILTFYIQVFGHDPYPRHLYNRKTKKTYTGLLPYVLDFCKENGLKYQINDNRVKPEQNGNFSLVEYIDDAKTIKLEPRPYQKDIVDNCPSRAIIQAATGAGKTFMMASLIAKFNVKPVCIFADKITLCVQLKEEMEKFLGIEVGLVGGGFNDYKDITVISLQSAEESYIKNAHLCLWDECHHIPSHTAETVARKCTSAYYRIGVSATPWRDAGDDMLIESVLSKRDKSTNINASTLIELGYLIKPDIYFVPVKQVFKGKNYNEVYNKAIVDNEDRNKMIYKIVKQMHKRDRKILILIKNIKHGEKMQKALIKRLGEKTQGIVIKNPKTGKDVTIRVKNIEFLSGSDNGLRRKAVMEAVKQKKCDVLIASTIADEGLDLPILDTLILAGGGKSSTRAFQRIGRVLRLYDGKKNAYVFDFVDYTPMLRRHSRTRQKLYKEEPLWDIHKFSVSPEE